MRLLLPSAGTAGALPLLVLLFLVPAVPTRAAADTADSCALAWIRIDSLSAFTKAQVDSCDFARADAAIGGDDQVLFCGLVHRCGRRLARLRTAQGVTYYAPNAGFTVEEPPWEYQDRPLLRRVQRKHHKQASSQLCLWAEVESGGGSFYVVKDRASGDSPVLDMWPLSAGTQVLACRTYGPLLEVSHSDSHGVMLRDEVTLLPSGIEPLYLSARERFCHALSWTGRLSRPSYLYTRKGRELHRSPGILPAETPLVVLSAASGRQARGRTWYRVRTAGSAEGYVPPESVRFDGPFDRRTLPLPRHDCPPFATVEEVTCATVARPVRWWGDSDREESLPARIALDPAMAVPVIHEKRGVKTVLVLDTVAVVADGHCLDPIARPELPLLWPQDRLVSQLTRPLSFSGSASPLDQDALLGRLAPIPTDNRAAPDPDVDELCALLSQGLSSEEILDTHGARLPIPYATVDALAGLASAGATPGLLASVVTGREGALPLALEVRKTIWEVRDQCGRPADPPDPVAEYLRSLVSQEGVPDPLQRAACLLYNRRAEQVWPQLVEACPGGTCATFAGRYLEGELQRQQGLGQLARGAFLDLVEETAEEGDWGHCRVALEGYRAASRETGHDRVAHEALGALCLSDARDEVPVELARDLCALALQAALAFGSPEVDLLATRLSRLDCTHPRQAIALALHAALRGEKERAVRSYARALALLDGRCPLFYKLPQLLLLQVARSAYEFGWLPIARDVVVWLQPETLLQDLELTVNVLFASHDLEGISHFLTYHSRRSRGATVCPEATLARAYLAEVSCRHRRAHTLLLQAEQETRALRKWAEELRTQVTQEIRLHGGTLPVDTAIALVDKHLTASGLTSDDLPELRELTGATGACGRWWRAKAEGKVLSSLPPAEGPTAILEQWRAINRDHTDREGSGCALALANLPNAVRLRVNRLPYREKMQDNGDAAAEHALRTAALIQQKQAAGKRRFCLDVEDWAAGLSPDWADSMHHVVFQYRLGDCGPSVAQVLSPEQRTLLAEVLADCRLDPAGNGPGTSTEEDVTPLDALHQILEPALHRNLERLALSCEAGASSSALLRMARHYLPLLEYVTHQDLGKADLSCLPDAVLQLLRSSADRALLEGEGACLWDFAPAAREDSAR